MPDDTPFSFHCMICFEEFNPEDRYPVVLPCGHTYVCNCCADRLDKCMECRTVLYYTIPNAKQPPAGSPSHHPNSVSNSRSSWSNARTRTTPGRPGTPGSSNSFPPVPPIKKRLPLPKNVVLLSLIEATELATIDAHYKPCSSTKSEEDSVDGALMDGPGLRSKGSMMDAEDDEEEKIKISTSIAVGMAGTYAVAAQEGLEIYPSRPSPSEDIASPITDEDVDTLVRFFHLDQKEEESRAGDLSQMNDSGQLSFGDRVQIVAIDGGWAKLARGYGYVRANRNQLVKVGGAIDRACRLEAMLRTLSIRRRELRAEQSKVDNQFIRLMNELQVSLQNDEDLTVIIADTFARPQDADAIDSVNDSAIHTIVEEKAKDESEGSDQDFSPREARNDRSDVQKPASMERHVTPPRTTARFACFAGGVFDSDEEQISRSAPQEYESIRNIPRIRIDDGDMTTSLFASASHPSPSAMRAGAQAWRDRYGQQNQGVDFRTGLSGHVGVLSSHAHSHEYLNPSYRGRIPRMSSHSGLSLTKKSSGSTIRSLFGALPLPGVGSPVQEEPERESFSRTGSM